MRNMSFFYTQEQVRNGSKDVTRRLGWWFLKPGDMVMAVEKAQGLGKGGKITKIRPIRIVSTDRVQLFEMPDSDVPREGFPDMTVREFVEMFCKHMKCSPFDYVNRIEFEYPEATP